MNFIDFGAFQIFKQMLSHDKIIFHMLFGAFQVTPRIANYRLYNIVYIELLNHTKSPCCSIRNGKMMIRFVENNQTANLNARQENHPLLLWQFHGGLNLPLHF